MPTVFFSYSHADENLRDQLEKQLSLLKRQGVIETWHDRRIGAGEELERSIDERLEACEIILLLVSPDFLASDYCYDIEMTQAMARHENGDAKVIPVILRPCMWHKAPFGKLMATPRDGRPVTKFPDLDEAFLEIAQAIEEAAKAFGVSSPASTAQSEKRSERPAQTQLPGQASAPRSSNLRLAKSFSDRDKDRFQHETFDYIAAYFANSAEELANRHPEIEGDVRRIDANRFTAALYKQGKALARCTVFIGGGFFGNGIAYSDGETMESNSCNESLRVEADDQMLFLASMGFGVMRGHGERETKLSQEGAAEFYWSMFIEPLQRRD